MKSKLLLIGLVIFTLIIISASQILMNQNHQTGLADDQINIIMRDMGDKILRQSYDSTSRVLPVKKLNSNTFLIEFQNPFSFVPDSLVKLIHHNLIINKLPLRYRISILDCQKQLIVFGYEINPKKNNLVPCLGREQIKACYNVQITFLENDKFFVLSHLHYFILGLSIFFTLFWMKYSNSKKTTKQANELEEEFIRLGKYNFYLEKQILKNKNEIIELSDKEAKLLGLLGNAINQTIQRDTLIKEVWENEGVFVGGRTLDVLISKLRKKIQNDNTLQITNIHGKGYKLEHKI